MSQTELTEIDTTADYVIIDVKLLETAIHEDEPNLAVVLSGWIGQLTMVLFALFIFIVSQL